MLRPLAMRKHVIAADAQYHRTEISEILKGISKSAHLSRATARPVGRIERQEHRLAGVLRQTHAFLRVVLHLFLGRVRQLEVRRLLSNLGAGLLIARTGNRSNSE